MTVKFIGFYAQTHEFFSSLRSLNTVTIELHTDARKFIFTFDARVTNWKFHLIEAGVEWSK